MSNSKNCEILKKNLKKVFNFNGVSLIISTCEDLGVTMMVNDDVNNR